MKNSIKLEELAMFLLSIVLFNQLDFAWWIYLVLILTPDIGMVGYAVSTQLGAVTYNLFHHKGIAVLIGVLGWYLAILELQLAGIILFGHASMDRIFGYGLKYPDHFKNTHLGKI
ncbi:MAG: DUF4260 domain-containing protein [Ekhidna sp.]